jgi:pimeloyl-ACP methyl ester carboxylesterase
VLVHGWCCDHSYFAPQFEYFSSKHRVVTVDLRGHGQSDKPQQSYTMEAFADDVVWLCGQLGLVRAVVIGHRMGSVVAFDLATRYPTLFSGIAMLDAAVVPPAGGRAAISHFLGELRSPDYEKVLREYVANVLFIPTDDQRRKERILDDRSSHVT